jgi:Protein of unknown function (DUF3455)
MCKGNAVSLVSTFFLATTVAACVGGGDDQVSSAGSPLFNAQLANIGNTLLSAAPMTLPAGVPSSLLDVSTTFRGVTLTANIGSILNNHTGFPSARITGAFRTTTTSGVRRNLLEPAIAPVFDTNAPAAQVYQCQLTPTGSFAWTFIRPEAGLAPITTGPVNTQLARFEHFLYPGSPATVAAGPLWREITFDGSQQDAFVGVRQASASNGTANIPLLRIARADQAYGIESNSGSNLPINQTIDDGGNGQRHYTGYVLRLNTVGGIAPTASCSSTVDTGTIIRVPYSSDYYFVQVTWLINPP